MFEEIKSSVINGNPRNDFDVQVTGHRDKFL